MSNLAMILNKQERREEAAELMSEALLMSSGHLGEQHHCTLICIHNLALVRWEQGKWKTAHDVWTRNLPMMLDVLGPRHDCTVRCEQYLAQINEAISANGLARIFDGEDA
ncbi:kinesin light chain [Colletotrichum tofieldiae]|nr:kinesin light chain [Colletotrichum tofieldiae]